MLHSCPTRVAFRRGREGAFAGKILTLLYSVGRLTNTFRDPGGAVGIFIHVPPKAPDKPFVQNTIRPCWGGSVSLLQPALKTNTNERNGPPVYIPPVGISPRRLVISSERAKLSHPMGLNRVYTQG